MSNLNLRNQTPAEYTVGPAIRAGSDRAAFDPEPERPALAADGRRPWPGSRAGGPGRSVSNSLSRRVARASRCPGSESTIDVKAVRRCRSATPRTDLLSDKGPPAGAAAGASETQRASEKEQKT